MKTNTAPTKAAKGLPTAKKSTPAMEIPKRLAINLHSEDADAWDRASRRTEMLILEYGVELLRRIASMPMESQPEIYEMPRNPGHEWQGNLRVLTLPESLGRSITQIAEALGVPPEDWAYSAILAETVNFRTSKVTATKKAWSPRSRAEKLGNRLNTPPDDILNIVTEAGLDALSAALNASGHVTLPLQLTVTSTPSGSSMLPVFLPAPVVEKLRKLVSVSDIEGGAEAFLAKLIGDTLDTAAADLLIDCWEINDPATIAALYEIQSQPLQGTGGEHGDQLCQRTGKGGGA